MDSGFAARGNPPAWQHRYERESMLPDFSSRGGGVGSIRKMRVSRHDSACWNKAVRDHVFPGCAFAVLCHGESRGHLNKAAHAVGRFTYEPNSPLRRAGHHLRSRQPHQSAGNHSGRHAALRPRRTCARCCLSPSGCRSSRPPIASDTRRSHVTLRMLLDHSSGLPGYVRLFESANDRLAMIDACLRQPLTADPGTRAEYSDIGFIILGHLIEKITGERLDSFCQREIFAASRHEHDSFLSGAAHARLDSSHGGRPQLPASCHPGRSAR